jgi:hypothetical protein
MFLRALLLRPQPRPLAWLAWVLLVIVLGLVAGHLLAARFLPFESRLPESLAAHTARVYAITLGSGAILLALSLRWPRVISAVYVAFLAGLLLLMLGKNVRELARNANPLGTEYALIHRTDDDSLPALLDASTMHGSVTYPIFYDHYKGAWGDRGWSWAPTIVTPFSCQRA